MDYAKAAAEIVEKAGGPENVQSVTHCMTRLRLILNDEKKADIEGIKKIKGVLGCVYMGEQLQVVLGANLIDTYNEVVKQFGFTEAAVVDENLDPELTKKDDDQPRWKRWGTELIGYISGSVAPMIPGFIGGGMLKVVLLLIKLVWPEFESTDTYALLSIMANAPFYFMPIIVAYGAAKKLGATPVYAMLVAAAMFAPDFLEYVNADPQEEMTLFGIPILLQDYSNSLLPALLLAWAAARFEKLWNKVVPGIFKSVFVGLLTMVCTYVLTMTIFAPLGTYMGNYIVAFLMFLNSTVGPLAVALLAGIMPFVIMTGVGGVFMAFMTQLLTDPGYDSLFRPALLLHNMAEGGACLGVALRAKNKEFKNEAFSIAIGCIVAGVSEPSIYGITLRLKRPMIGVCVGGAAGGLVAGLLGARAYIMGYSTILALPIFEDTIVAIVIAIIVAIAVSCLVTMALGFDESIVVDEEEA
ncbi:MAG: PTS transporter subunit EIIC [Tractidigestivibacter sp.]|jgi:PTS system beta-glucosides-specific IIC component|uniref:PTS transporter subunit EIIC n=1 Tax=Tractidigestivibacter sp. TaxID=2847320 RepID=UPI003D8D2A6C